ncbi:MAG: hypothetical protein IPJ98_11970 [Bryobacterales bacterium]|nr:hypothetical protein [Bryobacterales bacterium]
MRALLLGLTAVSLWAQMPTFGPDNPEGLVMYPNKTGRYAWLRKGTWTRKPFQTQSSKGASAAITAAELTAIRASFDKLSDLYQATPTGAARIGFFVLESRNYNYPNPSGLPSTFPLARAPLPYDIGIFPFYTTDVIKNGVFVPVTAGETTPVYHYFNVLPGQQKQQPVAREPNGDRDSIDFYPRPKEIGRYQGWPIYDGGDLVIARPNRDPWIAAPYARVLKAAMTLFEQDRATAENRLAGLKKENERVQSPAYEQEMRAHLEKYSGEFRTSNPQKWQGRVAGMERELLYNRDLAAKKANPQRDKDGLWYWNPLDAHAEAAKRLAALTPADAARTACFAPSPSQDGRYGIKGMIQPSGSTPACTDLVTDNWDYFDPKLPRVTPQLLLIRNISYCATIANGKLTLRDRPRPDVPPQGCFKLVPMWEELDWKQLAALVVP